MLVSLYMFIVTLAMVLFVVGILDGNLIFLSSSIVLFLVAGFYSFDLTFITANGDVLKLDGTAPLAFVWWGFAVVGIASIMYYGLRGGGLGRE